jgi:CheY-like chemotaxis protein
VFTKTFDRLASVGSLCHDLHSGLAVDNQGNPFAHQMMVIPDVTLMDLRLPDMSGIDALIAIREEFPEARIIILTTFESDTEIERALAAGALAYLLKSVASQGTGGNNPSCSCRVG